MTTEHRATARQALALIGLTLQGDAAEDADLDDEATADAEARQRIMDPWLEQAQRIMDHAREMIVKHNEAVVRENVQMATRVREASPKICAKILSRVDEELRLNMETEPAYDEDNPTVLWNLLRTHALNDDVYTASPLRRIQDAKNAFYELKQEKDTRSQCSIVNSRSKSPDASFSASSSLPLLKQATFRRGVRTLEQRKVVARDQNLAHLFLDKVHGPIYGDAITEWRRRLTDGVDEFPKTVEEAYNRLKDQKELSSKHSARGVAFATVDHGAELKGGASTDANKTRGRDKRTYKCQFCEKVGNLKTDCGFLKRALRAHLSELAPTGGTPEEGCNQQPNYTSHYCAPSAGGEFVPVDDWDVLCDNQSTVHVCKTSRCYKKSGARTTRSPSQGWEDQSKQSRLAITPPSGQSGTTRRQ